MSVEELRLEAKNKHLAGDSEAAILLLTKAIQIKNSAEIALDMVQILTDSGQLSQAQDLFNRLPDSAKTSEMGKSLTAQLTFKNLASKTSGLEELKVLNFTEISNYQVKFDLALCYFAEHQINSGMELLFQIQEHKSDFQNGAAKEMIVMICNMLSSSKPKLGNNYRQRLSELLN